MKKYFVALIVFLIIFVSLFIIYIKGKAMSREEFMLLMQSFEKVKNVKVESEYATTYIKDEICVTIKYVDSENIVYYWTDLKTNQRIVYLPQMKKYIDVQDNEDEEDLLENSIYRFMRI